MVMKSALATAERTFCERRRKLEVRGEKVYRAAFGVSRRRLVLPGPRLDLDRQLGPFFSAFGDCSPQSSGGAARVRAVGPVVQIALPIAAGVCPDLLALLLGSVGRA